jgi:hypothetical protein
MYKNPIISSPSAESTCDNLAQFMPCEPRFCGLAAGSTNQTEQSCALVGVAEQMHCELIWWVSLDQILRICETCLSVCYVPFAIVVAQ